MAINPRVFCCNFTILKKMFNNIVVIFNMTIHHCCRCSKPIVCASSIILIQSSLEIFFGLITSLTESTRISAPAPGIDCNPASLSLDRISLVEDFLLLQSYQFLKLTIHVLQLVGIFHELF